MALAAREVGTQDLHVRIDDVKTSLDLLLSGMTLLLGKGWQRDLCKSHVVSCPERFEIHSQPEDDLQPDEEVSPERASSAHNASVGTSHCARVLCFEEGEQVWEALPPRVATEVTTQTIDIDTNDVAVQVFDAHRDASVQTDDACTASAIDPSSGTTSCASQIDAVKEDCERLLSLKGEWKSIIDDSLQINSIIKVRRGFLSAESAPVNLDVGLRGIVTSIDDDGDAVVYFPTLVSDGFFKRIVVFRHDFVHLSALRTERS